MAILKYFPKMNVKYTFRFPKVENPKTDKDYTYLKIKLLRILNDGRYEFYNFTTGVTLKMTKRRFNWDRSYHFVSQEPLTSQIMLDVKENGPSSLDKTEGASAASAEKAITWKEFQQEYINEIKALTLDEVMAFELLFKINPLDLASEINVHLGDVLYSPKMSYHDIEKAITKVKNIAV